MPAAQAARPAAAELGQPALTGGALGGEKTVAGCAVMKEG